MKRYTYIIIFLFLSLTLVAQEYSIDELYDKACLFFAQSNSMQQELGIKMQFPFLWISPHWKPLRDMA